MVTTKIYCLCNFLVLTFDSDGRAKTEELLFCGLGTWHEASPTEVLQIPQNIPRYLQKIYSAFVDASQRRFGEGIFWQTYFASTLHEILLLEYL